MQPLEGTVLSEVAFGPVQSSPGGYFSAPTVAPVGSLIPVEITYDDRRHFDNLILIDPNSPDNALTGSSGRNTHRIGDEATVYRRAADTPGIYELRLRRWQNWDRRVMARSEIELVDIDIDIQVPDQVGTREEFEIYMNPVMDGHLVIVDADRDPENLVRENTRRNNLVSDAEGPGLFTRTSPASTGEYEVRFHFNQQHPSWSEHMHRTGRLMARAPLRVVDAAELEAAEPELEAEAEAEAQEDQLAALEAQIAELSENLEAATVAQADDIHAQIAALGLPALALLIELLDRDQITPQLVQVFTAPQPPAQWAAAATPAPAPASQPAAPTQPAADTSAAAAPSAAPSQPVTAAPQTQTPVAAAGYAVTGVAADDVLNVRSGPGTENMITGMLPPNATGITPTGDSAQSADGGTWWQIADPALPGGTGWVNARFLALAGAASPAQAAPADPAPAHSPQRLDPAQYHQVTGIAANEVLYLRSSPAPDAPIVGMLPPDATRIIIIGETQHSGDGTEWVEILHPDAPDGNVAWVEAAYLEQIDALPTNAEVAQNFTHVPGMNVFDTYKLEQSIANILHYAPDSALAPGHGLSPLTKSIVALQAIDGRLPHARYHLTYRMGEPTIAPTAYYDLVELIELRRFNLGPARHAATVAAHGAENTADIAHFGEGPDVVWRFAMRPLRGNDAVILSAARAEIDTPEGDCMGFHCQMAQSIVPHMADWGSEDSIAMPDFRPSYDELWQGAPSAPAALDALALTSLMAETDGGDARWHPIEARVMDEPGAPFIEVIIEVGMGQDTGAEVGYFATRLRDDETMSVWYRLGAFGGPGQHHVIRSSAAERWPDRQ
ncbi:MAG: SH3 domain-containing protein [Pararhodobacter sp.]|nr:SH3 domain-containing protein [Pararhodobacter sp.]